VVQLVQLLVLFVFLALLWRYSNIKILFIMNFVRKL